MVKNALAMWEPQEMQVQSLGREDPLEEGMATHSSILAWTEEHGGLQSIGSQKFGTTEVTWHAQTHHVPHSGCLGKLNKGVRQMSLPSGV